MECSNIISYPDEPRCSTPPPASSPKSMRSISVEAMDAGFIVRIGCQTFAIESKESLITKLSAYIRDPQNVESAWMTTKKLPKK